jgi:hypothetical protein
MRKTLKPTLSLFAVAIAALTFWAVTASATQGAHFFAGTSASVDANGALSVFIDEGGVGNATVNYTIDWTASATYGCFNGGGNHPKATNKETSTSSGSAGVAVNPTNGRVMTTIDPVSGTPPPPPSDFSCPSGQTLALISVSYNPVVVTDTTNGVSITLKT